LINENLTKDSNGSSEIQILKLSKTQWQHENFGAMGIGYARKSDLAEKNDSFTISNKQTKD
jgi:hypothetical protein